MMNALEEFLAEVKAINADAKALSEQLEALEIRRNAALLKGTGELGMKHRKVAPMLPAISYDIMVPDDKLGEARPEQQSGEI